jgi:hypothetical protein
VVGKSDEFIALLQSVDFSEANKGFIYFIQINFFKSNQVKITGEQIKKANGEFLQIFRGQNRS